MTVQPSILPDRGKDPLVHLVTNLSCLAGLTMKTKRSHSVVMKPPKLPGSFQENVVVWLEIVISIKQSHQN